MRLVLRKVDWLEGERWMGVEFQEIRYECNGKPMHGRIYRSRTKDGDRPAVLIFPEFFGIGEHTYRSAERLAEQGYIAMACDLHGGAFYAHGIDDELRQKGEELFRNKQAALAVGTSALAALQERHGVDGTRVGAIGYCFGGYLALELAFAGLPLAASVAFHPSLENVSSTQGEKVKGRILLCLGTDDPVASPEMRARFESDLKGTAVRWQMNLYGSVRHGFTNPNSPAPPELVRYDEAADRDSWTAMTALLEEVMPVD